MDPKLSPPSMEDPSAPGSDRQAVIQALLPHAHRIVPLLIGMLLVTEAILALVVIVIGGIGSIRGALAGAVIIGMVDTLGRAFLRPMLSTLIGPSAADNAGPALASMLIYLLMATVLYFRPQGLFPALRG